MAKKKAATKQILIENIGPVHVPSWKLEEASGDTGRLLARGIFGEADAVNGNGRIYPKDLIEGQIKRLHERLSSNQVMGHLDHPDDGRTSLMKVSHYITKLWMDGSKIMGEAVILNTEPGKQLRALLKGGVTVGISSRGRGSVQSTDKGDVVQEDFQLDTFDFVADPSVKIALPKVYSESMDADADTRDPVTMFKEEFPEAYAQLTESASVDAVERAKEKAAKILDDAVASERTRVQSEMTETFERQLRDALVGVKEDLEREIREEYAKDPEVGGAKAALAQIVEMVQSYHQPADPDAMSDALRAADLEKTEIVGERDEAIRLKEMVERQLELEQRISGHPMAKQIREVLKPVVSMGQVESVEYAVDAFLAESKGMVPEGQIEALAQDRVALAEAKAKMEAQTKQVSALTEQVNKMRRQLAKAAEIGEQMEAETREAREAHEDAMEQLDAIQEEQEAAKVKLALEESKLKSVARAYGAEGLLLKLSRADSAAMVEEVISNSGAKNAMVDKGLEEQRKHFAEPRGVAPGAAPILLEQDASVPKVGTGKADRTEADKVSAAYNRVWST